MLDNFLLRAFYLSPDLTYSKSNNITIIIYDHTELTKCAEAYGYPMKDPGKLIMAFTKFKKDFYFYVAL